MLSFVLDGIDRSKGRYRRVSMTKDQKSVIREPRREFSMTSAFVYILFISLWCCVCYLSFYVFIVFIQHDLGMLTLQAARQPGSQAARQPGSQLVSYVWSIVPHVRAILNMIACIARASHALSHPVDLACETVHPWNRKNNLCFRRGSYDEHDGCSVPQPLHPRCAYSKERNINLFSRGFLWLLATFAYRRQVANRLAIRDLLEAGGQVPASANRGGERGRINVCYIYIYIYIYT